MTIALIAIALAGVGTGVGLMLFTDRREQRRMAQNGGRRF